MTAFSFGTERPVSKNKDWGLPMTAASVIGVEKNARTQTENDSKIKFHSISNIDMEGWVHYNVEF